jgi:PTH1 family peptidyl-tRNA hydrolase
VTPLFGGRQAAIDWLIVGLGNPGRQYDGTRHNIGFLVADVLAERWMLPKPKQRFRGHIAEGRARTGAPTIGAPAIGAPAIGAPVIGAPAVGAPAAPRVAVLWPQTYMNEAGLSAGPARGSYKLALDRLLVVHDEIDLPFGEIRARLGGGLAGHNGLKSLKRELGSPDFWRVRVGVGRPDSTDPEIVSAYVLGRFREPAAEVRELVGRAADEVERMVLQGPGEGPEAHHGPGESKDLAEGPSPEARQGPGESQGPEAHRGPGASQGPGEG